MIGGHHPSFVNDCRLLFTDYDSKDFMNIKRSGWFGWGCGLGVALGGALVSSTGLAASVSVNPAADAFVTTGPTGNLSNSNYGGAGALSVAAPGSGQGEFQSVLQFNLAGARSSFDTQFGLGQWSLQSVTLQVTAALPNNGIFNPSAAGQFGVSWMQNDSWVEGAGTPNGPSATGINFSSLQGTFVGAGDENLGTFGFDGSTTAAATYNLNLSSGFLADLLAGNNVSLRMFAADNAVSYLFDSRNFSTVASRPLLTLTAVPEPGSAALVGMAVLGGVVRRRFGGTVKKSETRKSKLE